MDKGWQLIYYSDKQHHYTVRTQVAEGLNLAAEYRAAVDEAWTTTPAEFEEITSESLGLELEPASRYVERIEVISGAVELTFGGDAHEAIHGRVLVFVPAVGAGNDLAWVCGYAGAPAGHEVIFEGHEQFTDVPEKYLPAACR